MVLLSASEIQAQTTAYQFKTTDGNFWKMSSLTLSDKVPGKAQVVIRSSQPQQTFLGWGTCFNELPWDAYNLLSDNDKQLLVNVCSTHTVTCVCRKDVCRQEPTTMHENGIAVMRLMSTKQTLRWNISILTEI